MMRIALAAAALVAAVLPASASAENTPAGPATLINRWSGPTTLEGRGPEVLVGASIAVAPGGQAGMIRIRADNGAVNVVGDEVQLPAEPGTYTFAAPHIRWDYRVGGIGIDQATGGHAIFAQFPYCNAGLGPEADPCRFMRVDVYTPPGGVGEPTEKLTGAHLAVTSLYEPDFDQDLAGDKTEDRTDLKVSAVPTRNADGTLKITVKITNAGPRTADLPSLTSPLAGAQPEGCSTSLPWYRYGPDLGGCSLAAPIAVGETRTVIINDHSPDAVATTVSVTSEGPDLQDADNTAQVQLPAADPFAITLAKSQRLRKGVRLSLVGVRDGKARVIVNFAHGVRLSKLLTLKARAERQVILKAGGAKLRTLRRAARKHALKARITVRGASGEMTARTSVRF